MRIPTGGVLALAVGAMLVLPARGGMLRTVDGKSYDGDIRFENGQLVVQPRRGGAAVKVALSEVFRATFRTVDPPPQPAQQPPAAEQLPSHLKAQDVGPTGAPGSVAYYGGTLLLKAAGIDFGGRSDACFMVGQELWGDGQVVARLVSVQRSGQAVKAGLIIRDALNPTARAASAFVIPGEGAFFSWRKDVGGRSEMVRAPLPVDLPMWLKLTRRDNVFRLFVAPDRGGEWVPVGEAQAVAMDQKAWFGLAACSREPSNVIAARFDALQIRVGPPEDEPAADGALPGGGRGWTVGRPGIPRGVVLRNGTVVGNALVVSADDKAVRLNRPDGKQVSVATDSVARLVFAPVPAAVLAKVPPHVAGIVLTRGDFMEAEFQRCEGGQVRVSSVLFGISRWRTGDQVACVVLHDVEPPRAPWVVRTHEGYVYMARTMQMERDQLIVEDESLGTMRLSAGQVAEIAAGGDRISLLAEQPVTAADWSGAPTAGDDAWRPAGGAAELTFDSGVALDAGVVVRAGASITYDLGAARKVLLCRIGIPRGVLPTVCLRVILSGDGRELYRSTPRTSQDDVLVVSQDVAGIRSLTVRVENTTGLGGLAVIGDAVLVR